MDASETGIGADLSQLRNEEHSIPFISHKLLKHKHNYSMVEKDFLAISWALKKNRDITYWGENSTTMKVTINLGTLLHSGLNGSGCRHPQDEVQNTGRPRVRPLPFVLFSPSKSPSVQADGWNTAVTPHKGKNLNSSLDSFWPSYVLE